MGRLARTSPARLLARLRRPDGPAAARPADGGAPSVTAPTAGEREYFRVARGMVGAKALPDSVPDFLADDDARAPLRDMARRQRAMAVFAEHLAIGHSVARAQVAAVHALVGAGYGHTAIAMAESLGGPEQGEQGQQARRVAQAVVLLRTGRRAAAWEVFRSLPLHLVVDAAAVEAVDIALSVGGDDGRAWASDLVDVLDASGRADVSVLTGVSGRFLAFGDRETARRLVERADREVDADTPPEAADLLENLRAWVDPDPARDVPAGAIPVGIIDYHQPDLDLASRNVGDYVQTLAVLGNLARFQGTRFTGPEGLGELLTELQDRIRPELRIDEPDAHVDLFPMSRDWSVGQNLPENTWALVFGWHMHPVFASTFGLPYHPHVNPLFVSFHINDQRALSPEAIEYLREHGPIGCRDWTTVYLLLACGVDAFFTGCITTTVDAVFPDLPDDERPSEEIVGVVDLPSNARIRGGQPTERFTHIGAEFRDAGLVDGVRAAEDLLDRYRHRFTEIVTSRLHCYLPATSLGIPVRFRPRKVGDVRFDGLLNLTPGSRRFTDIRDGIRELIGGIWPAVLRGDDPVKVYAAWRELTAPAVARAREALAAPSRVAVPEVDFAAAVAVIRAEARRFGDHDAVPADVTEVALSLDQNLARQLPVTVESLLSNASGPVRLWITARGLSHDYERWFASCFPDVPITFLNCDHVDYGEVRRMLRHITVATMDRLLLPEVLDKVDRLVYVDIDTVTEGDVCELGRTNLGQRPLAARTGTQSAFREWWAAGDRLAAAPAHDLRRRVAARYRFDFRTFNAGVLVLDLARMRADRFVADYVPLAGVWGFNDQDILNFYTGPDRAELDTHWNAYEFHAEPAALGIVHFAGQGKPWDHELVVHGEKWRGYAAAFAARTTDSVPPRT